MSDQLLPLYDQELAYLRTLAGEFADAHPKIAGRLRLSADAVDDPHVARLIEGFALIAARIRQKLDDEFPELTDSLLGALYPHMLAPFPSASIARFSPLEDLDGVYRIARGTPLEMEPIAGEACRYRTTQDLELWPIAVRSAELGGRPLVAPAGPHTEAAVGSLRLVLECLSPGQSFTALGMDRLRFYVHGLPQHAAGLYELLCNNLVGVALADHPEDRRAVFLGPQAITPVGFSPEEGLLPYSARSLAGYRLLGEYFSYPQKFLFVDLAGISAKTLLHTGGRLEIFFYFDRAVAGLERQVSAESFALGCTPIVNLFSQRAEPIALTHEHAEYHVVPDSRRHATREVYAVDRVTLNEAGRGSRDVLPFFASHHAADPARQTLFWTTQRRRMAEADDSTDVTLSIVDTELNAASPTDGIIAIETTCLNRELPRQIPYGGNRPAVSLVDGAAEVTAVRCMAPPTPTLRPPGGRRSGWRLVSQLSLNHLSLGDGAAGADALREILRLHDLRDVPETRAAIDSIRRVTCTRGTARLPGNGAICRGVDVALELDARRLEGTGAFLLASVIDRFLGLYASINSFTRLTVRLHGRDEALCTFRRAPANGRCYEPTPPRAARLDALSLGARLRAVPHRFDGLHALRLAELGHRRAGTDAAPDEEALRLPVVQGLAFAPAPVAGAVPDAHGLRLRVAFLGLTGPLGVLPQVYAELVQRADRLRNRSVSAFLDMFNHRLVSLFLRASEKYRLGLLVQRQVSGPAPAGRVALGGDPASAAMLALAGFGTPHLRGRMSVADEVVLYYAGIFAARTRPPGALQAMLADYLAMPVRVEPFSGRWVAVDAAEQTRLPRAGETPRYASLGIDTVAGARIWDVQGQFRVVVGPVDGAAMRSLMPDQPGLRLLADLVRAYAGIDLGFDVQVVLRADCVPALALGADDGPAAPRLGWNTWAKFLPVLADKDDIILDPDQVMGWQSRAGTPGADLMERT